MNHVLQAPVRVRHELRRRTLQVVRAETVTPRMRRIVLGGPELVGFTSAAPDDHVKLFFPQPGQIGPDVSRDAAPMVARDYTPRHYDAARGELAIEFVLHGEGEGPASDWARAAVPGDRIVMGGPRGSLILPPYPAHLLVGDETALPAMARRLEELEAGVTVLALIEVADRSEEQPLPSRAHTRIVWLHRDGVPAGQGTLLQRALAEAELPSGDLHAWLAGEIETMRTLRHHLVEDRGLPRDRVRAAGYWRVGDAGAHGRIED